MDTQLQNLASWYHIISQHAHPFSQPLEQQPQLVRQVQLQPF
jgi:hypothetical protein